MKAIQKVAVIRHKAFKWEVTMSELMTAIFQGKRICILDIVDKNGQYIEKMRSVYREASQAGELFCPECHGILELCAGAIIPPYFRHRSIQNCSVTKEMGTEAGKRRYQMRKRLYTFAMEQDAQEITIEEGKSTWPFNPVLMNYNHQQIALIYLDGKSRNYSELKEAYALYQESGIKTIWFLNKKYQSKSQNLTSDEAENTFINEGMIYYLDIEKDELDIRKSYTNAYGECRYYTETFPIQQLKMNEVGNFHEPFIKHYREVERKEKRKLDKVLRVPIEEGIDEIYFDFAHVFMDSLMEIWILPPYQGLIKGIDAQAKADTQRTQYLKEKNNYFKQLTIEYRYMEAENILRLMDRRRNVWEWLN